MNSIEKFVYDKLKKNQKVKNVVRNIYQGLYDILPQKPNYSKNVIVEKKGYFFGFHDVSPFSYDETHVLANRLEIPLRMPTEKDGLTVGYWDSTFEEYKEIWKTYAWNYHKGCRLQWRGCNCEEVVFNSLNSGKIGSTIYNLATGETKFISFPIDTVSPNGRLATSFSYERLNKYMPGYGYLYKDKPFFDEAASDNTGLFIIDLDKNTEKMIVSLATLADIQPNDTMKNTAHFVTHTEFSPDGKRVAFLHRWTDNDPDTRFTRLVTCKLDGTDIHISNTSGMVSHFAWNENCGIIAYCQVNGIDGHYLFSDYTISNPKRIAKDINSDGHQSISPSGDFFITDTYPDKRRHAKLYKVCLNDDNCEMIADLNSPKMFQSPSAFKHWACDLHPRISPTGKYVSFDSVHENERAFCVMEI